MQKELRQVTAEQIRGRKFKAIATVEDKSKILIFLDDGTFITEDRNCKVDPLAPMGYDKG